MTIFIKENTGDTRQSPAITICKSLLEEGATLSIVDPKVTENQILNDLNRSEIVNLNTQQKYDLEQLRKKVNVTVDCYEAAEKAHAIIICTKWDIFRVSIKMKRVDFMNSNLYFFFHFTGT